MYIRNYVHKMLPNTCTQPWPRVNGDSAKNNNIELSCMDESKKQAINLHLLQMLT